MIEAPKCARRSSTPLRFPPISLFPSSVKNATFLSDFPGFVRNSNLLNSYCLKSAAAYSGPGAPTGGHTFGSLTVLRPKASSAAHFNSTLNHQPTCSAMQEVLSFQDSSCSALKVSLGDPDPSSATRASCRSAPKENPFYHSCAGSMLAQTQQKFCPAGWQTPPPPASSKSGYVSECLQEVTTELPHQEGVPWGLLEHQQQRLECLHQTIQYCEDRCSMGRALRSREAAARARLLRDQLRKQQHQQQQRQQRNNKLMEEAVGWGIQKALSLKPAAAQRLRLHLSELHKHMQKALAPSAFALAFTSQL